MSNIVDAVVVFVLRPSRTIKSVVTFVNPLTTGNPFFGTNYLDLVWGGVRGP